MDGEELLRKHNPVLVVFPQDSSLIRPGEPDAGAPHGDYHPCSVDFFLARAALRPRPRRWEFRKVLRPLRARFGSPAPDGTPAGWRPEPRTGSEEIRRRVLEMDSEETTDWELDVADIPSQNARAAWKLYHRLLREPDDPHGYAAVAYGRVVPASDGRTALQYWYLYAYNDFANNHEGDWEMVTVAVDENGEPTDIALSNHHGGLRRSWASGDVRKIGDRPVVRVARGSHAGFFRYVPGGVPATNIIPQYRLPGPLRPLSFLLRAASRVRRTLIRLREHLPADRTLDGEEIRSEEDGGELLEPTLQIISGSAEPGGPTDCWWLKYRGSWGSTHSRLLGTVGPGSPWASQSRLDIRWSSPIEWLESVDPSA